MTWAVVAGGLMVFAIFGLPVVVKWFVDRRKR